MRNILVVAAHPDDEALGCGGTMARHVKQSDKVHVLFLADGETARGESAGERIGERRALAEQACSVLGAEPPSFENFPDNQMDTVALIDVVRAVEKIIERVNPEIVYTHHGGDLNVDHRLAHQAVLTACRPVPGHAVSEIYSFETASSTEWNAAPSNAAFLPNHFVDISEFLELKMEALGVYAPEMREFPHARSLDAVKALATWRGASAGLAAAEAFMQVRTVLR